MKISRQSSVKVISSLVLAFSIFSCSINQINVPTTTPNYKNKSDINSFKIKYSSDFNPKAYYLAFDDVRQAIKNKQIPDVFYHYVFTQSSEPQRLTDSNYLTIKNRIESGEWSEEAYLMANPDIISLISSGTYKSGYDHWYNYAQINEPNRITSQEYLDAKSAIDSGFNEKAYRLAWSDIDLAIKNGTLFNSYTHYNLIAKYIEPWRLTDANYLKIKSAIENGFDEKAYLLANSDVKSVVDSGYYKTGLEHYLIYGVNENRLESSSYQDAKLALLLDFDETRYRMAFPDVDIAIKSGSFTSAFHHFYTFGKYENKLLDSKYINTKSAIELGFQENAYLLANPDVKNVVISGYYKTGLEHYLIYGANENRLTSFIYQDAKLALSLDFDEASYRAAFPEIDTAIKSGSFTSAFHHFYTFGKYENRLTQQIYIDTKNSIFNEQAYLLAFPEVKTLISSGTYSNALAHYNNYGKVMDWLLNPIYGDAKSALALDFDEARYRFAFPYVDNAIKNGQFTSGFHHYYTNGKYDNLLTTVEYLNTKTQESVVNEFKTNAQANPAIAIDSVSGKYVMTWLSIDQDGSVGGIFGNRFSSSGIANAEFKVNTYTQGSQLRPSIAMNSNSYVITWDSQDQDGSGFGVFAKIYNSTGAISVPEFQVNTRLTGNQYNPSVAMDNSGNFIVSWQSDNQDGSNFGIYAQRFDSLGNSIDSEFRVNTYTVGAQINPSVSTDTLGNFVVTWQSANQDGSGYGIYGQRYNSLGQAQGTEFRVNAYTRNNQKNPVIATDLSGNFTVVWQSDVQDGSGFGIYAQRYNSIGTKIGSEFRVNSYTTNFQENPSIATDNLGNFVITWQSNGQDGDGYGVYYQKYNSQGQVIGFETQANLFTTNAQYNPVVVMDNSGNFVITWQSYTQDGSNNGIYTKRFKF